VFHPLNAYEQDGSVILDVVRYARLWDGPNDRFDPAHLTRWTIDLGAGTVKEEQLDDRAIEFPRVDPRVVGRSHRYGYALESPVGVGGEHATLVKYDQQSGDTKSHDFGAGREPGEPVFVPRQASTAEDDGWVLTYVYDAARDTSDFVILDAQGFAAPPEAVVALPQRVPFGFHGSWIPDRA
jgi:carotenoid cleavage dioxygenase-like enzyme